MNTEGSDGMSDDEVGGALRAGRDAVQRTVPDEAPECFAPGCQRLGVIVQNVSIGQGTRTWHWCVIHDPEG